MGIHGESPRKKNTENRTLKIKGQSRKHPGGIEKKGHSTGQAKFGKHEKISHRKDAKNAEKSLLLPPTHTDNCRHFTAETQRTQRKPSLEINMSTRPREAVKPFDFTPFDLPQGLRQGHEPFGRELRAERPGRMASSPPLVVHVAIVSRLRLAPRASPAISSKTKKAF
jgi:hypothetical protein